MDAFSIIDDGDTNALRAYIAEDASRLHEDTSYFGTPLHYAARDGNLQFVQCLVDLGADVNFIGESGNSALTCAIRSGDRELVEYLLSQGAVVNLNELQENPYLTAIYRRNREMVRFFLDYGIDPHVVMERDDGSLRNAYSFSLDRGETEIAKLLESHGCKLPDGSKSEIDADEETQPEAQAIVEHITERYGESERLVLQSILPDLNDVLIHYIRPSNEHPFSTIFTTGMSDKRMKPPDGASGYEYTELILHLPLTWPDLIQSKNDSAAMWPLQVMRMIGSYPHVTDTWLGPLPTLALSDPPEPLGTGTLMSAVLLIPDKMKPLLHSGKQIDFYTVYPIYSEEMNFAQTDGINALIDRMVEAELSALLDPQRSNTC